MKYNEDRIQGDIQYPFSPPTQASHALNQDGHRDITPQEEKKACRVERPEVGRPYLNSFINRVDAITCNVSSHSWTGR